jgi:hypothetical protein
MYRGVLAALAVSVVVSPGVRAQTCAAVSYEADAANEHTVIIDANSGAILSGHKVLPMSSAARLVFVHKNPMRYQYAFSTTARRIESAIIADGLAALGVSWAPEQRKAEEQAATTTQPPARAPTDGARAVDCEELFQLKELLKAADGARKSAAQQFDTALTALEEKRSEVANLQQVINRTLPAGADESLQLCGRIDTGLARSKEILEHQGFAHFATGLEKMTKDLDDGANAVLAAAEARRCSNVTPTVNAAHQQRADIRRLLESIASADEKLATARGQLNPFVQQGELVRQSENAFIERRSIGPVDEATEYDVSIARTDRLDGTKTTVPVAEPVRMGRSRFTFSAGVAVVFSDQRSFERQSSVTGTGSSAAVVDVVGVDESSDAQAGAVAQLNAMVWQGESVSVGWSVGASLSEGQDGAQFGFYTGPTLAMAGDRFVITAAYHLHEEETLAGGFSVGDELPSTFTGEIPVTTEKKGGLLLSFTFRVR